MALDAEQIEWVREIIGLASTEDNNALLAARVDLLTEFQEEQTIADIAEWQGVRGDSDEIKRIGPIEFFQTETTAQEDIRIRVRLRLGFSGTASTVSTSVTARAVPVIADW